MAGKTSPHWENTAKNGVTLKGWTGLRTALDSRNAAEKAIKIESLNLKKPAEDVEAKLHEEKECADNDQDMG